MKLFSLVLRNACVCFRIFCFNKLFRGLWGLAVADHQKNAGINKRCFNAVYTFTEGLNSPAESVTVKVTDLSKLLVSIDRNYRFPQVSLF